MFSTSKMVKTIESSRLNTGPLHGIEAEVILGSLSRKCSGHGICKVILIARSSSMKTSKCVPVSALIDISTEWITFNFRIENMPEILKRKHFNTSFFYVEEDSMIEIFDGMVLYIKQGKYPKQDRTHFYTISFRRVT